MLETIILVALWVALGVLGVLAIIAVVKAIKTENKVDRVIFIASVISFAYGIWEVAQQLIDKY